MAVEGPLPGVAIDPALAKIINVMGSDRARAAIADAMRRAQLTALQTPNDRLKFAMALMKSGGIFEAIGRSIKIQAILHGAKSDPSNTD
jgi:hypothetical protein